MIHPRLADIQPLDHWQQDGLHYFVFPLRMTDGRLVTIDDAPVVVFTMHPEATGPISVVVVTPSADGGDAEVVNLRHPDDSYTKPLPPSPGTTPAIPQRATIGPAPTTSAASGGNPSQAPYQILIAAASEEPAVVESQIDSPPLDADGRERDEHSPTADSSLLSALSRSPEYQTLQPRLAEAEPIDRWQDDGLHYFVFQLRAVDGAPVAEEDAPVAVFAMRPGNPEPVSAVVVKPGLDGETPTVLNLRETRSDAASSRGGQSEAAATSVPPRLDTFADVGVAIAAG